MVTLEKLGDGVKPDVRDIGERRAGKVLNSGTGPVRFIGGVPHTGTRRVDGPLILVAGMRVRVPRTVRVPGPCRVRAVAVSVERDGFRDRAGTVPAYRGVVITQDGGTYVTGPRGDMASVRLAWLRLAVESGTLCRVVRMS